MLPAALFAPCNQQQHPPIRPPAAPLIDLRPTWVVVTIPYLRLRAEPSESAAVTSHLRRGDVARVDAIDTAYVQVDGVRSRWFLLETDDTRGWAPDAVLSSFVSEQRARNVARRLAEQ